MLIFLTILGASCLVPSSSLRFIDLPPLKKTDIKNPKNNIKNEEGYSSSESVPTSSVAQEFRRNVRQLDTAMQKLEEQHDISLKTKISTMVQQTIHDTTKKIEAIQNIKTEHRDKTAYKAGFLINLIKKSKDVVNELFNVGVTHKDDWKALEQMKTYELLVHANVDTDNLVKQLMDLHNNNNKKDPTF